MDLKQLIPLLSQAALLLIVAAVGLQARWADVLAAIRQPKLVLKGILAVSIIVPAVATLLCMALPMDPAIKTGIVIMAVSPLAPLLTGKMMKAKVEASFAVGLYVALIAVAVPLVPLTVELLDALLPPDASVPLLALVRVVATSVLAPLAVGVAVASWAPGFARRAAPIAMKAGYAAMALLALPIIVAKAGDIAGLFGNGTVLAIVATVIAGLAAGHFLGGPDPHNRNALALAAATRHPGIASLIVTSNFSDPRVMLAVMLFLAVAVILSLIYQQWMNRRSATALAASG